MGFAVGLDIVDGRKLALAVVEHGRALRVVRRSHMTWFIRHGRYRAHGAWWKRGCWDVGLVIGDVYGCMV
jgi:hypothetical protein